MDENRIRWRCRRGLLELDILLSGFLQEDYQGLTTREKQVFSSLIDMQDQDLWALVTDASAPQSPEVNVLLQKLRLVLSDKRMKYEHQTL